MKNSSVALLADLYTSLVEDSELADKEAIPENTRVSSALASDCGLKVEMSFDGRPPYCSSAAWLTVYDPSDRRREAVEPNGRIYLQLWARDVISPAAGIRYSMVTFFPPSYPYELDAERKNRAWWIAQKLKEQMTLVG